MKKIEPSPFRSEKLGIKLGPDAVEGVGVLMRYRKDPESAIRIVDAIINNAPPSVKPHAIQNIFTWLKQSEDKGINGIKELTDTLSNYPRFVEGGYHYLNYAVNKLGLDKIRRFEFETGIKVNGIPRRADIVDIYDNIFELKNIKGGALSKRDKDQFIDYMKYMRETNKDPETITYVFRGKPEEYSKMVAQMKEIAEDMLKASSYPNKFIKIKIEYLGKETPFYIP